MHCLSLPSLVVEGGDDAAAGCVAVVGEALRSGRGETADCSRACTPCLEARLRFAGQHGACLPALCLPVNASVFWYCPRRSCSSRCHAFRAREPACAAGAPARIHPASSTCHAWSPGPSRRCAALACWPIGCLPGTALQPLLVCSESRRIVNEEGNLEWKMTSQQRGSSRKPKGKFLTLAVVASSACLLARPS